MTSNIDLKKQLTNDNEKEIKKNTERFSIFEFLINNWRLDAGKLFSKILIMSIILKSKQSNNKRRRIRRQLNWI